MQNITVECTLPPHSLSASGGIQKSIIDGTIQQQYLGAHMCDYGIITSIRGSKIIDVKACSRSGNLVARVSLAAACYFPAPRDLVTAKITHIHQHAILASADYGIKFVIIAGKLLPYIWTDGGFEHNGARLEVGQEIILEILVMRYKNQVFSYSCELVDDL